MKCSIAQMSMLTTLTTTLIALSTLAILPRSAFAEEHRILYIGDSHSVGTFGRTLDALLRKAPGFQVSTYAVCSSSPDWFFTGQATHCGAFFHPWEGSAQSLQHAPAPLLTPLLEKLHPEFTIVALGANQLRGTIEDAKKQIHRMTSEIHAKESRCIWVGPPDEGFISHAAQDRFYEMLTSSLSTLDCPLIDSRKFTKYPPQGGDRIHYDSLGAAGVSIGQNWGKSVGELILNAVNHTASASN
jgi:hypothetical protein